MNGRARDFVDYTGGDGGFLEAAIFIASVFGVLFAVLASRHSKVPANDSFWPLAAVQIRPSQRL
jgi:hypothetical protein